MTNITYTKTVPQEKTAVALGLFDGVHIGHQDVIKCAVSYQSLGMSPAVFTFKTKSLTSKRSSSIEYLLNEDVKIEHLSLLGVEYLFSPDFTEVMELTAEQFVITILKQRLNARVVVCGEDFTFGCGGDANAKDLAEICERHGILCVIIPLTYLDGFPISSSLIRYEIKEGNISKANSMLGYTYCIRARVIHGDRRGREMNYPTINQSFPEGMVVPHYGVYASRCYVNSRYYPSITNIGLRPTVSNAEKPIAETHIIGFNGDLYGQNIKVELKSLIRDEKKFNSVDELVEQIKIDTKKVKGLLRTK